MRRLVWLVPVVGAALLGAGCSGSPGTPAAGPSPTPATAPTAPSTVVVTPDPLPPGVGVSFIQQRIDEGTPRSQVRVVNGSRRTLRVRSVGVAGAGFALRSHPSGGYRVYPQQVVDLRYRLPRPSCTPRAASRPAVGVVVVGGVGRTPRVLRRPVAADGVRFLTRLRESACHARRLAHVVDVRYGDGWVVGGRGADAVLHGSLVLTRVGAPDAVAVTQAEGSVLFDLALGRPRTLPAARDVARVPVVVRGGGRCDPHSRGQSTQTFLFRAWFALDGGEPVSRLVVPTASQQTRLLAFLDGVCAGGGG